jgi:hypothetical protein
MEVDGEEANGLVYESTSDNIRMYSFRNEVEKYHIEAMEHAVGVEHATRAGRYGVHIYKGKAFEWPEIEKGIKAVFTCEDEDPRWACVYDGESNRWICVNKYNAIKLIPTDDE